MLKTFRKIKIIDNFKLIWIKLEQQYLRIKLKLKIFDTIIIQIVLKLKISNPKFELI